MKAIDIRSESAVKLLSEFLDLDTPYVEGGRHMNAEHFAHGKPNAVHTPSLNSWHNFRGLLLCEISVQRFIRLRQRRAGLSISTPNVDEALLNFA